MSTTADLANYIRQQADLIEKMDQPIPLGTETDFRRGLAALRQIAGPGSLIHLQMTVTSYSSGKMKIEFQAYDQDHGHMMDADTMAGAIEKIRDAVNPPTVADPLAEADRLVAAAVQDQLPL
jgi:hypothetical protein